MMMSFLRPLLLCDLEIGNELRLACQFEELGPAVGKRQRCGRRRDG